MDLRISTALLRFKCMFVVGLSGSEWTEDAEVDKKMLACDALL